MYDIDLYCVEDVIKKKKLLWNCSLGDLYGGKK